MFNIWMTFTVVSLLALIFDTIVNCEARLYNAELIKEMTGEDSDSTIAKSICIMGLLCLVPILHWFLPFMLIFGERTKKFTERDVEVLMRLREKYRNINADDVSPQEVLDDINTILDMQK